MTETLKTPTQTLDKRAVIETHVDAATILVSQEQCAVSARTIIMAIEEILQAIYKAAKASTPYDYRNFVREDRQRDYIAKTREKYNFFKHADRDAEASISIDFEEMHFLNELNLSFNIMGYHSIFGSFTRSMEVFIQWFALSHRQFIKWEALKLPAAADQAISELSAGRPDQKRMALRTQLTRSDILPRRDVEYWLHKGKLPD